ncbi:MAG: DNA alkylation repair protein [Marinicella sp.]
MQIIGSKKVINDLLDQVIDNYRVGEAEQVCDDVHQLILVHKVRFPVLQHAAQRLFEVLKPVDLMPFCDATHRRATIGGNVLIGIILQCQLSHEYRQSLNLACQYIADSDTWYVCDIIGERVFGFALLNNPYKAMADVEKLLSHDSEQVVRALGAGMHLAVKKGLSPEYCERLLLLILPTVSNSQPVRQGLGWAAKTIAKFHADLIHRHVPDIATADMAPWLRRKILIGLERNRYASSG